MRKQQHIIQALVFTFLFISALNAHCEIPCGIYDDHARVELIIEHINTVEKAMDRITSLENEGNGNSNQAVRWVMNKEKHASEIQHIVSQYFMTQRIKPDTDRADEKLSLLHRMLISAMKCKQTTDQAHVSELRSLTSDFETLYFNLEQGK